MHFAADELEFKPLVYTPNAHTAVIELEEGTKYNAVLQDIQFHPVSDKILHVDFYELFEDKPVTMEIPIRLEGTSPGVRNGGRLILRKRKLTVRALPANLPDEIVVDISKLKIGGNIAVESVMNDNFTILHPANVAIVQVKTSRNVVVTQDDDEEGAEGEASSAEAAQ